MATLGITAMVSHRYARGVGLACLTSLWIFAAVGAAGAGISTTTTTLEASRCSQPISTGPLPTATDCLFILNAAVGLQSCGCECDPTGDGNATATDALLCLNVAVGGDQTLMCPCDGTTTTSTTTDTSTSTTTTTTTTTTMGGGADPVAGGLDYGERCSFCHRAGSVDPTGDFSDLAGDGDKLVMDLGTIDDFMDGIFMTQQEIDNMAAFLDGL